MGPSDTAQAFRVGALCIHRTLEASPLVQISLPLLADTFWRVASIRTRTAATLGGALAHADPNQDPPPSLMVLAARGRVRSSHGQREVEIDDSFVNYYEAVLDPDKMATPVIVPRLPANPGPSFLKFLSQTQDDDATVAVAADRVGLARVGLGAAAATPVRAATVEAALQGQPPTPSVIRDAAALVAEAVEPSNDLRGSADYKRNMAAVFVRRALTQALTQAGGGRA